MVAVREDAAAHVEQLPLMLTVPEVAQILRIGRNEACAAVADGSLPSVRIGRTIRVPRNSLAALLGTPPDAPRPYVNGPTSANQDHATSDHQEAIS